MCVPNLVSIGPQTATCIRLEGYTHRHTLSYIDIDRPTPFASKKPKKNPVFERVTMTRYNLANSLHVFFLPVIRIMRRHLKPSYKHVINNHHYMFSHNTRYAAAIFDQFMTCEKCNVIV